MTDHQQCTALAVIFRGIKPSSADVRTLLDWSGLTQAAFGGLIDAAPRTVSHWLAGTRQIPRVKYKALYDAIHAARASA